MSVRENNLLRYIGGGLTIFIGIIYLLMLVYTEATQLYFLSTYGIILIGVYLLLVLEGAILTFKPYTHLKIGLLLIIESLPFGVLISASPNFYLENFNLYLLMAFVPIFIGGLLGLLYNPPKKIIVPRVKGSRIIFTGVIFAIIGIVASAVISLIYLYTLSNNYSPSTPPLLDGSLPYLLFSAIDGILCISMFIIWIFLKTDKPKRAIRLLRISLLIAIALIVSGFIYKWTFYYYYLYTNVPQLISLFMQPPYAISNLPNYLLTIKSIGGLLTDFGIVLIIIGSIIGIVDLKKVGFWRYLLPYRKIVVVLFVVIVISVISVSYYNSSKNTSDNAIAIKQLNQKISTYDYNLKYLLSNQTMINQFYNVSNGLKDPHYTSGNDGSLSKALISNLSSIAYNQSLSTLFNSNGKDNISVDYYDWLNYNPLIRAVELNSLEGSGIPILNLNKVQSSDVFFPNTPGLLVPKYSSPLQSLWELKSYAINLLVLSQSENWILDAGYFNGHPTNGTLNNNGIGFGMILTPGETATQTSVFNSSLYDSVSTSQIPNDWIGLILQTELSNSNYTMPNMTTFYLLSLNQYQGYLNSEILYNTTIPSEIDLISYLNNETIINLGNMNLSDPKIILYIDGNQFNYTRYWNYLVIPNKHLGIGAHEIKIIENNLTLSADIYIAPTTSLYIISQLSCYKSATLSCLKFEIQNPYQNNLTISNITLLQGLYPAPSVYPNSLSSVIYNNNPVSVVPEFVNATYYRFNYYKNMTRNDTVYGAEQYKVANYSVYQESAMNFTLYKTSYIELLYGINNFSVGQAEYFTLRYDTNYGPGQSYLIGIGT